ncbi:hypothetical protein TIFTF001_049912 [Ficus carica]|uniref:CRM domain-containing protein n=1 Tax=Ficus carica TaxID=3494 RepID=A0AA87YP38_FICCA|nr:hypothetical protein TIFTF001_049912 [Ficus carica]
MELRQQERKFFILNSKIEKSKRELLKMNAAWKPSEQDADQEMLTEEERECFRKIGLQMQSVLVLGNSPMVKPTLFPPYAGFNPGRRGIFDGVMEGLHQHWKHREVAKVITMQRYFWRVMYTAKLLEAESGGVLISVEKLKEGHAIIIYRGKNYRRPLKLISPNLLTKRKALSRSLEMQRIGSLKFFAYQRQRAISDLKVKLDLDATRPEYPVCHLVTQKIKSENTFGAVYPTVPPAANIGMTLSFPLHNFERQKSEVVEQNLGFVSYILDERSLARRHELIDEGTVGSLKTETWKSNSVCMGSYTNTVGFIAKFFSITFGLSQNLYCHHRAVRYLSILNTAVASLT